MVAFGLKKYRMVRKNADTNSVSRSERAVALILMTTSLRRDASELQHARHDHHHRQPPMNRIAPIAHIVVIATYSPSMNNRYGVEPYSTMKPATSSDSASTRSNGGRLVSASAET